SSNFRRSAGTPSAFTTRPVVSSRLAAIHFAAKLRRDRSRAPTTALTAVLSCTRGWAFLISTGPAVWTDGNRIDSSLEAIMRMMLRFTLPVEKGNQAFNDGSLAKTMESVMIKLKPEAAYFAPLDGKRAGMLFFDVAEPSTDCRNSRTVLPE